MKVLIGILVCLISVIHIGISVGIYKNKDFINILHMIDTIIFLVLVICVSFLLK